MNANPWQRLHKIVADRIDQLGATRDELHARGGPSPAWLRGLKDRQGKATVRQASSLLDLDAVMGWHAGTARGIINDDRSHWTPEMLEAEAYELAHENIPTPIVAPNHNGLSDAEQDIRTIQTMVAAALRGMDDKDRVDAIRQIIRILGV